MSSNPQFNGCINWQAYDTRAIWQVLQGENAAQGYRSVVSWHAVTSHLDMQEERLRAARDTLAQVWPPESNESARAFVQDLDRMLISIAHTRESASNIRTGLEGIVGGLADVREEVRLQLAHRMDASDDIMPRWADHAEDEIDAQVRLTMASKEKTFIDYSSRIQPPEPFVLPLERYGGGTDPTGPTISGDPGTGRGTGSSGGGFKPVPVPVPHDPPAPRPGHDPFSPTSPVNYGGGTTLEGARGDRASAGRTAGDGPGSASSSADGSLGTFVPGMLVGGLGVGMLGGPGAAPVPSAAQPVSMRTGLPSGTVIGGGGGTAGGAGTGARAVSPGVIGGGPGGAGIGPAAAGRSGAMMPGMHGGRRAEQGDAVDRDPDNPWGADEGVAPVIQPDDRVIRHDAGGHVIGWTP